MPWQFPPLWTGWEILGYYDLSTKVFDALSNQSMTFHNSRYGGALVSQTSKFTNAFSALVELFMYSMVPLIASTVLTIVLLLPLVPLYVAILTVILVIYVITVWLLFRRALPLNSLAASAQNMLSGSSQISSPRVNGDGSNGVKLRNQSSV